MSTSPESVVRVADGKYEVRHSCGAGLRALRHGQPWRDLTGDGLVLALVHRIEELEARQAARVDDIGKAMPDLCPPIGSVQYAYTHPAATAGVPDGVMERLIRLQVGGCSCSTKTPELKHHREDCRYRLAAEVMELLAAAPAGVPDAARQLVDTIDDQCEHVTSAAVWEAKERLQQLLAAAPSAPQGAQQGEGE